ncbi:hypothetical protein SERLA73DRAFT_147151 [Serpula lacrymans var. lacrymans S7.3]|uniref:Uncharacterized protein n=2 Tax=Serpula lacrymans var. lacrymans TaxID=341189 RepID=F8QGV5_SERL3|nr:uncharacterized protein SERLADRAFT_403789 [Serpula lacrymans var. lacrymans S7.9]EGN92437.1 hypothetical protein SERLA73DRAFT_147151 [Serpula lacrymans var. lacrymans S7.3]EGO18564.1 hypothetical protein SERLADRAFT_403789 [Serpula lacrymans var. lacrymans S7.9]
MTSTKSTDDLSQITTPPTVPRKPAALLGSADFDLRNASVYAELFNPGGAGPRSGLNRKEKEEERRKELNKMRDEARAKRAEETVSFPPWVALFEIMTLCVLACLQKNTFDLQSQADKISRFEDRLRQSGSLALHPNFLAAKFRDDYERERKRQRDKVKDIGSMGKEEGEA